MLSIVAMSHMVFALNHWRLIFTINCDSTICFLSFVFTAITSTDLYIVCTLLHILESVLEFLYFLMAFGRIIHLHWMKIVYLIISKTLRIESLEINLPSSHTNRQKCRAGIVLVKLIF